jgi:hypothetical protein
VLASAPIFSPCVFQYMVNRLAAVKEEVSARSKNFKPRILRRFLILIFTFRFASHRCHFLYFSGFSREVKVESQR